MYYLNKIVGWLVSPVGIALAGLVLGFVLRRGDRENREKVGRGARLGKWVIWGSVAWLWIWATPMMGRFVGAMLEREFLVEGKVPRIETFPNADAIELHGGSMGFSEEIESRGEMWTSADRVWMAARLWKELSRRDRENGREIKIYCTGGGVEASTKQLLLDFGVPEEAIVFNDDPRNTEEEAVFIAKAMKKVEKVGGGGERKPKVLVVTSAWHMKRTMLMYKMYAPNVEAIPAACDFENSIAAASEWSWIELFPSPAALMWNSVTFHEWLGILGYKFLRP